MREKDLKRFNKLYPWFAGLTLDLMFWEAVDTWFLTLVKGLSASQIVTTTSVSLIACLSFQIPIVKIINRIGNTNSVKLGSFLFLIAACLLTVGPNFYIILLGKIFYEFALTFLNMANAILKNNLNLQNKGNEYIKYSTRANMIYSVATMIMSFTGSFLFNLNHYLPMAGCIFFCFVCFVLSFFMVDYSDSSAELKNEVKSKAKIKFSKIVVLSIASYALFYPIVHSAQADGKLFIQQQFLEVFSENKAALIFGIVLSSARTIRVISNLTFNKVYLKYKDKVGVGLPILLILALAVMLTGSFIGMTFVKVLLMGLGYVIYLFIRDPFKTYIQNLVLINSDIGQQQAALNVLDLVRKAMKALIELCFAAVLLKYSIRSVMIVLIVLAAIEIFFSFYLYSYLKRNNKV